MYIHTGSDALQMNRAVRRSRHPGLRHLLAPATAPPI
jgi:hypothetical protein